MHEPSWRNALATDSVTIRKPFGREASPIGIEIAERIVVMRASQLYANFSTSECTQIAERARTRIAARNELLFMQGQPFRQLVLVESGCVKLTRLSANGSEVIVELRGPHDVIDLPAGSASRHTSTARAVVNCKVLTWDWSFMETLLNTPQISRNICLILTGQLNELQERYHEISAEKVGRRLACTLIRLSRQFGIPTERGVEISLSRHELAQMTGTTLFTVSRLISKWGELGLVVPRREAVLILDAERLHRISEIED